LTPTTENPTTNHAFGLQRFFWCEEADMHLPDDPNFFIGIAAVITAVAGLLEAIRRWRR
jgi:hypothetical protein